MRKNRPPLNQTGFCDQVTKELIRVPAGTPLDAPLPISIFPQVFAFPPLNRGLPPQLGCHLWHENNAQRVLSGVPLGIDQHCFSSEVPLLMRPWVFLYIREPVFRCQGCFTLSSVSLTPPLAQGIAQPSPSEQNLLRRYVYTRG